jgi:hypothetical protein
MTLHAAIVPILLSTQQSQNHTNGRNDARDVHDCRCFLLQHRDGNSADNEPYTRTNSKTGDLYAAVAISRVGVFTPHHGQWPFQNPSAESEWSREAS